MHQMQLLARKVIDNGDYLKPLYKHRDKPSPHRREYDARNIVLAAKFFSLDKQQKELCQTRMNCKRKTLLKTALDLHKHMLSMPFDATFTHRTLFEGACKMHPELVHKQRQVRYALDGFYAIGLVRFAHAHENKTKWMFCLDREWYLNHASRTTTPLAPLAPTQPPPLRQHTPAPPHHTPPSQPAGCTTPPRPLITLDDAMWTNHESPLLFSDTYSRDSTVWGGEDEYTVGMVCHNLSPSSAVVADGVVCDDDNMFHELFGARV